MALRKGADSDSTLEGIHQKVKRAGTSACSLGSEVVPSIDRSDLVHYTTHTVMHNLTEGIILVAMILFLFLGNLRGALIVALTIPFSLLFASICLDLRKIPANLLSLGALDFGMVVDGTVVMVENIVRHLGHTEASRKSPMENIREAAHEVQRPVFYAIAIIITAYLPIFTLQRVEGRLFKPMAWTVAFALLGALLFSMLVAPVLASSCSGRAHANGTTPSCPFLWAATGILPSDGPSATAGSRWGSIRVGLGDPAAGQSVAFAGVIGSEFLPHLDEGAIWVRGTLAGHSTGPTGRGTRDGSGPPEAGLLSRGHRGYQPDRAAGRRHRHHRLLQHGIFSST